MGINKVMYGSKTVIDLSGSTVAPDKMLKGIIGYNAAGEEVIGTHQCQAGIGTGAYVWAIYDTKEEWNYTTKSLTSTYFPDGYDSTTYVGWTITNDGYFELNKGTTSGDTYYLPEDSVGRKAKKILRKGRYSVINPYTVMTVKDAPDTVKGDNLLGYISTDAEDAYPLKGVQDNKYYIRISGSDADVTAGKMLSGIVGYTNNGKVTGSIQSQAAQTITPNTKDITISSGKYLSGAQTIKGDSNLIPTNIKKDVSIFGVTGTLEASTTEADKTGNGEYIWRKCSPEIGWVESRKDTGSKTKPSGYSSTKYTSFEVTDDGYYKLSDNSITTLIEFYLPSNASNGSTKTILYKPFMSNYQIWTLSDEKDETGKRGDILYGYVSSTEANAYPNDGVQDHYYYSMIFNPSANVTANKMLKDTVAFGQTGKVTGTIDSISAQTITPGASDKTIASGKYLSGTQTIKGDANLLPENIKSGISIFGVIGTYESSGSSGGKNVAQGTITGAGSEAVTIDTGLTSVATFVLYAKTVTGNTSGVLSLYYDADSTRATGLSNSGYLKFPSNAHGEVTVDGGNITYTPKSENTTTNLMIREYDWIAIE